MEYKQKHSVAIQGIVGSRGACVAKSYVFRKRIEVKRTPIEKDKVPQEIERLETAIKITAADIQRFREVAEKRHGEEYAAIFDSHLLMLEDPQFKPRLVKRLEEELVNVESIVRDVIDNLQKVFSAIEDPYLRERAIDIKDVGDRLLRHLMGLEGPATEIGDEPYVLVAQEVTPSEILDFARGDLRGVCLDTGGATSHVAILAGALGIPSVFGLLNFSIGVNTGETILMDTRDGCSLILNPSEEEIKSLTDELDKADEDVFKSDTTLDGYKLNIAANIARIEELPLLKKLEINRIGLYRSEFVFMESMDIPSEGFQQDVYSQITKEASEMVVLRTIDIGSDKPLRYLPLGKEENPAMGFRSVRFSLSRQDILEAQLRAMIKAAQNSKDCKIIFPMVSVIKELKQLDNLYKKVVAEIKPDIVPEWGIMLEVPSACYMLKEIAQYTKYISIGTNDLMQFFYAVDRTNEKLVGLTDCLGVEFLRFLSNTMNTAKSLGMKVGICGEMAADPVGFIALLGMGVDEFSMRPSAIDQIKALIPQISKAKVTAVVTECLSRVDNCNLKEKIKKRFLS
jgi:phosphotransferase system enzyme I (PtsI)